MRTFINKLIKKSSNVQKEKVKMSDISCNACDLKKLL